MKVSKLFNGPVSVFVLAVALIACSAQKPAPAPVDTRAGLDPYLQEILSEVPDEALTDPLLVAASRGDAAGVRALLQGGRAHDSTFLGERIVELIAGQPNCAPDVLDALIDAGADPRYVRPVAGDTALLSAAASASVACFDRLLARGADPSHVEEFGFGLVANAYLSGDAAFFAKVLDDPTLGPKHPTDLALALQASLTREDWAACGRLLAAGADPQQPYRFFRAGETRTVATSSRGPDLANCQRPAPGSDDPAAASVADTVSKDP